MYHRPWHILFVPVVVLLFGLAVVAGLSIGRVPQARAASPIYVRTDGHDTLCNGTANVAHSVPVEPNCALATVDQGVGTVDPGGTVYVAAGTYTENVSIGTDVTVQGAGESSTIIDGGGSGRVILLGSNITVTISGVTIRNGSQSGGGGVYVDSEDRLTLISVTISGNTVTNNGGGIYMNMQSTVTLSKCTVVSNTAGSYGGGIYGASPGGTLAILDSAVISNSSGSNGGGVYQSYGALTIDGSSVISNTAGEVGGGGVYHPGGTLTISDSTILSNTAESYGGGIHHSDGSTLIIENSTVRGNRISGEYSRGGGIFSDGKATLTNVTIAGNSAVEDGGGIHSQEPMTITNVTVSGNQAQYGGGILHTGSFTLTVVNCTIVSNTVSSGGNTGGVRTYAPVSLRNSILAHNDDSDCYIGSTGSVTSKGHNLESGNSCGLGVTGDMTNTTPGIAPLQDNGGDTWTHALLPGSMALDAVPVISCTVATDQRGVPRPQGPACDIGAYEEGQVTLALTKSVDDHTPDPGQVITFAIAANNSGILSATNALISDTLHLSLTLAGPVTLDPPQPGATLAQNQGDLPILASGVTISDGTNITLTFPVTVDVNVVVSIITNTAAITSADVITPQVGSVTISLESYVYLPLVLRSYQ